MKQSSSESDEDTCSDCQDYNSNVDPRIGWSTASPGNHGTTTPAPAIKPGLNEDEERRLTEGNVYESTSNIESQQNIFSRLLDRIFDKDESESMADEEAAPVTETSALLPNGNHDADSLSQRSFNGDFREAAARGEIRTTSGREVRVIWWNSVGPALTFLLQRSQTITSIFAVGHLGNVELGAVSIAVMTVYITGFAIYTGLATALDTLCGQAYGAGKFHLVGLHVQRMVWFQWTISIPIVIVWLNSEALLSRIVEPQIAHLATQYLRVMIVAAPMYAAYESGKRFLQSQGLYYATLHILLITTPLNIFLNWFLVWHLRWGFIGSPIAVASVQVLQTSLLVCYVRFVAGSKCWGGFTWRAFANWRPLIKLALSGFFMVFAECFAFECLTLASSRWSIEHLDAGAILINIVSITFQCPFGFSVAASTRIAHYIGAGLPKAAKTSALVALGSGLFIGLANGIFVFLFRRSVAELYTDDPSVIALFESTSFLVTLLQILDASTAQTNGILRGLGLQRIGGFCQVFSYYVIGLPIAFSLAFGADWKLQGLWTGMNIAILTVVIVETWYLFYYKRDWQEAVDMARVRNRQG